MAEADVGKHCNNKIIYTLDMFYCLEHENDRISSIKVDDEVLDSS